jgi:hypothetical protein
MEVRWRACGALLGLDLICAATLIGL